MELRVHAHPGASRTKVSAPHDPSLEVDACVWIPARAVEGAANTALGAAVAAALGVRPSVVTVRSGVRSRYKVLDVPEGATLSF